MHLSAIFKEYGIDIYKTKIVRHPLKRKEIKEVYEREMIEAYQSAQSKSWFDDCDYVASFVGTNNTEALFIGLYKKIKVITGPEVQKKMPKNYPYPEHFDKKHMYYVLKKLDFMSELEKKLVVEWGKSTQRWVQWATTDKEVLSIANRYEEPFPGYDDLIITYPVLQEIVEGEDKYKKWSEALSCVNGIYLICDKKRNKQYIGSTYNDKGILGRWKDYCSKGHDGGDEGLKEHLKKNKDAYYDFQFTILRILPLRISQKQATDVETIFKQKLCTKNKSYGLNRN